MRILPVVLAVALVAPVAFGAEEISTPPVVEREDMVVAGREIPAGQMTGQDPVVASSLASLPGVDLRAQGVPAAQSDLSIRGSSFSGAGLALNGFALPNAQTEHFNTELPLPPGILSAPTVYTGFDQALAGEGHLIGTVDFSLLPMTTGASLSLGLTEHEGYWGGTLVQQRFLLEGGGSAGVGAFAGASQANAVDYPDNDLRAQRAGGQAQWVDRAGGQWDLVFARQEKEFGARGYYGVTPLWAATEKTEDTLLFTGWTRQDREGSRCRISALYREQTDDYTLFWTLPGVYNNQHKLETYGVSADGRWLFPDRGMLDWRVTGSGQEIRSDSLGDHERLQMGLAAVPGIMTGKWLFQAGARMEIFEETVNSFLPQAAVTYQFSAETTLKLAHSGSVRQPSYTELNYESPASLGNAGLENQTAATTELIFEGRRRCGVSWKLGIFYQETRDTVDWVRANEDTPRWEARDIGTVAATGVEAGVAWRTAAGSRLATHYTGMVKDSDMDLYASRYALDYPEHLLQVSGYLSLGSRLGVEYVQNLRYQADNPLRGSSDTGYDARLALHTIAWRSPSIQLSLAIDNLWDDDFEVFPGQETVSPQRLSASVAMDW